MKAQKPLAPEDVGVRERAIAQALSVGKSQAEAEHAGDISASEEEGRIRTERDLLEETKRQQQLKPNSAKAP